MSKFNSNISVLGIEEVKVQQAILKLLENSIYQKELIGKTGDSLNEQLRLVRQQLSQVDFNIDEMTAQEIADKISVDMSACVASANASKVSAAASAASADEDATACHEDAQSVLTALENMEGTIAQYATQAATTASAAAVSSATQAAQTASDAAATATQKAEAATTSAQNAAQTAQQAASAAEAATAAVLGVNFKNLSTNTVYDSIHDQYRKVATLPAVSSDCNSVVTIFGSMGGATNSLQKPIYLSLGQRQDSTSYETIDVKAYVFGSSLPASADIVLYKESNNTFSLYLKGAASTYFKHNLSMTYTESVTLSLGSYVTSAPTGTLVWSLLSNYKVIANVDDISAAITNLKNGANTWSGDQTFSGLITANGKVLANPTSGLWYQGRDLAAFRSNLSTASYVPILSAKSKNGSWDFGPYTDNDTLYITHITDENHSSHTNSYVAHIGILTNGRVVGVASPEDSSNDTSVPNTMWVRNNFAPATVENIGWAHINEDLNNSSFYMAGLVSDTSATYNVKITFKNTKSSDSATAIVNNSFIQIPRGGMESCQLRVAGDGSFKIDNIFPSTYVFIRIWR